MLLNEEGPGSKKSAVINSTQVSLSSNAISTCEENKKSNANSLLLTPMVDSPILNEIIDPRLVLDVTPPQKPQLMTEEIVPQLIRSSTPALNEYSSRPLLLSTIENVDEEVNCSSSSSQRPSKMQKYHMTTNFQKKLILF